jgi:hypothetical protein
MLNDKLQTNFEQLRSILEPIVFCDLFEYPLTAYEIWKYTKKQLALEAVFILLQQLVVRGDIVSENNGFYFLKGREYILEMRQKRYNYSCAKLKIASRFSRLFALVPFVKTVAVANFIGDHNVREEGDIDLLIITASHRIWTSRLFCTGFAKILNRRPTSNRKKDRICLSFYISEDHLDVSDLANSQQIDYWYYYLRGLMPIYDKNNTFEKFLAANNIIHDNYEKHIIKSHPLLNWLELIAKKYQLKIMPPALKNAINNSEGVRISDSVLKFHLNDKRRYFSEKFNYKLNEVISKIN